MDPITIHGSLFYLLKEFINRKRPGLWLSILEKVELKGREYNPHEVYPVEEFDRILAEAARFSGKRVVDFTEEFGADLVPSLLSIYGKFVDPKWRTFELLMYTEMIMHKAVRKEENKAAPPVLNVSRVHDKLLVIDYYSKRKLGSLAVGIIRGIAKFYKEEDKVKVIPQSEPGDERVQIRVEFA